MERHYFYRHSGQQFGPLTFQDLQQRAGSGELQPDDMVQLEGAADWSRADAVPDLAFPGTGKELWQSVNQPVGEKLPEEARVAAFLLELKRTGPTPWGIYTIFGICIGVYALMV